MHAHSSDRSLDSGVRATVIAEQAHWRGLDGVVLTEHNSLWPAREAREIGERFEVIVIPGMELGTDAGHVLVYGLDRYHPELLQLESLRRIVLMEGGAMVMAHPMRTFHGRRPGWDELPTYFDGIQAADHKVAAIGGSDVHSRDAVGRCATIFPKYVFDGGHIAELIRSRQVRPVDFRPRPHSLRGEE
jgi:hypothetical protein